MKNKQLNIVFTGDLCCHNRFAEKLQNNEEVISESLKATLGNADFVVLNYEGSSYGEVPVNSQKANLKNSLSIAPYLKTICNPIFNLANNHIMDYGNEGLSKTIDFIKNEGIPCFGAGASALTASAPICITKNNIRVNIWGVHAYSINLAHGSYPGLNGLKCLKQIKKTIKKQDGVQKNIICIHGGEEFTFFPMPYKRWFLRKIAKDICPDVIICHHSHSIQGHEKIKNTLIFYSLGNFMFDYPSHLIYDETNCGLLLDLQFTESGIDYSLSKSSYSPENSLVDCSELEKTPVFEERLYLKNYRTNIQKDAYRVVFESKKNRNRIGITSNEVVKRNPFNLFSINKLRILKSILTDSFLFSLYFQALKFKILTSAGNRKNRN